MKKQFFVMAAIAAAVSVLSSCSESEDVVINPQQPAATSAGPEAYRPLAIDYPASLRNMKALLGEVADSAWCADGEVEVEGYIDVERLERVAMTTTGYQLEQIRAIEDQDLFIPRERTLRQLLTEAQFSCFSSIRTYLTGKSEITDEDVAYIQTLCDGLSPKDRDELMAGVMLARLTIEAANSPDFLQERGVRFSAGGFICNFTTTFGIGGLWSMMGTQVLIYAGVAAGPAGVAAYIVAGVGAMLLADIACPRIYKKVEDRTVVPDINNVTIASVKTSIYQ